MKERQQHLDELYYEFATEDEYMNHSGYIQYVYVIFNPLNGLYKIGQTEDIDKRYKQLRTQTGIELEVMMAFMLDKEIDISADVLEKKILHEYFKRKRVIGEWFKLSLRDLYEISVIGMDFHELMYHGCWREIYKKYQDKVNV